MVLDIFGHTLGTGLHLLVCSGRLERIPSIAVICAAGSSVSALLRPGLDGSFNGPGGGGEKLAFPTTTGSLPGRRPGAIRRWDLRR